MTAQTRSWVPPRLSLTLTPTAHPERAWLLVEEGSAGTQQVSHRQLLALRSEQGGRGLVHWIAEHLLRLHRQGVPVAQALQALTCPTAPCPVTLKRPLYWTVLDGEAWWDEEQETWHAPLHRLEPRPLISTAYDTLRLLYPPGGAHFCLHPHFPQARYSVFTRRFEQGGQFSETLGEAALTEDLAFLLDSR